MSIEVRDTLFGTFTALTFVFSLMATLWATILYSALNLCGKENAVWFAQTFWWQINKPGMMMIISLITMVISIIFSVGGLYSDAVNYTMWSVGLICMIMLAGLFYDSNKKVKNHMGELLRKKNS